MEAEVLVGGVRVALAGMRKWLLYTKPKKSVYIYIYICIYIYIYICIIYTYIYICKDENKTEVVRADIYTYGTPTA